MIKRNIQASVFLQILSVVIMVSSWTLYGMYNTATKSPAPGFFPFCMGGLLLVLATILQVSSVRKLKTSGDTPIKESKRFVHNPRMLLICFGTFLAGALLIEVLGFILTMVFVMAIYCKVIDSSTPWKHVIIYSVISPTIMYFLFVYALQVRLPQGVLPI